MPLWQRVASSLAMHAMLATTFTVLPKSAFPARSAASVWVSAFSFRATPRPPSRRPLSLSAAATSLSFDPATDVRDRATATLVVGRKSALGDLVARTDAYVSLFGFRSVAVPLPMV